MPRKPRKPGGTTSCVVRKGLTVEQAKKYWDRKGPGSKTRQLLKKGAKWRQLGNRVFMTDKFGDRTQFVCERGEIVAYSLDY